VLIIGQRRGYPREPMPPHNLTLTILGAGLLWVGWLGFNAGSALAANGLAVSAFVVTNLEAAAAALSWMFTEWWGSANQPYLALRAARRFDDPGGLQPRLNGARSLSAVCAAKSYAA
jgi:ammonia channel protein AmtB